MSLPFTSPPESLCLLRLSALGDISHSLPVVRTIQRHWPQTRLSWIIGRSEHALVADLPGVEFIIFDKRRGWHAYRDLRRQLKQRRFDALLHMQMSLRASMIAMLVQSPIKLGFDRQRAKDLQWLFSNHKIAYQPNQHVIESFLGFSQALGIPETVMQWDIPLPDSAREFARRQLPADKKILAISPCSSMAYRNWDIEGYAQLADYAATKYDMTIVLTGGPSTIEREYADAIQHSCRTRVIDLVGRTSVKELLAILAASSVLLAPDSGPAHLATAVATPVIGLYAATNPDRARPYLSSDYVVNCYPEAIMRTLHKTVQDVPFGTRVRQEGTMSLISVEMVKRTLDRLIANLTNTDSTG